MVAVQEVRRDFAVEKITQNIGFLSMEDIKSYLNISPSNTGNDGLIADMVAVACASARDCAGRSFAPSYLDLTYDYPSVGSYYLPYGPVLNIQSVSVEGVGDNPINVDSDAYVLHKVESVLSFSSIPSVSVSAGVTLRIRYNAGLSMFPENLRYALMNHIYHAYTNRGAMTIPPSSMRVYDSFKYKKV